MTALERRGVFLALALVCFVTFALTFLPAPEFSTGSKSPPLKIRLGTVIEDIAFEEDLKQVATSISSEEPLKSQKIRSNSESHPIKQHENEAMGKFQSFNGSVVDVPPDASVADKFPQQDNTEAGTQNSETQNNILSDVQQPKLRMSDGSTRELLSPESPIISISERNARLIDMTKEVAVKFQVMADGSVPIDTISITPAAVLPSAVRNEIRAQLSSWLFSPTQSVSEMNFRYTIVKY